MSMLIPFKKQAFSRFVLFFSVTRLSMVMMHSMVLVSYSMKVYEQYCAQCPGLSILPSPVLYTMKLVFLNEINIPVILDAVMNIFTRGPRAPSLKYNLLILHHYLLLNIPIPRTTISLP